MGSETVTCPCDDIKIPCAVPNYDLLEKISKASGKPECLKSKIYRLLYNKEPSADNVCKNANLCCQPPKAESEDSGNENDFCDCECKCPACTDSEKCLKCEEEIKRLVRIIKCTLADDLVNKNNATIDEEKVKCTCDKTELCVHKFGSVFALPLSNCSLIGNKILELLCDERKKEYAEHVKEILELDCDVCCESSSSGSECQCTESSSSVHSEKDCIYRKPIVLQHFDNYRIYPCLHFSSVKPYKLDCLSKSDVVAKWGNCQEVVESVLKERDKHKAHDNIIYKSYSNYEDVSVQNDCKDGEVCSIKKVRKPCVLEDVFDDINRFKSIKKCGYAKLCRNLVRWTHYMTKNFDRIQKLPHVVIHIPSLSYPKWLRRRIPNCFRSLQAIQIGRLGWLGNPNAQVIYVFPCKSTDENVDNLKKFVTVARPDVNISNLWIIQLVDDTSNTDCCERSTSSGIENLFHSPMAYRRLRLLSAGRQGFIIPGVMHESDTFVASELQTPFLGTCMQHQHRLLNKYYMMCLLEEAGIPNPPFCKVQNLEDLFSCFAALLIEFPEYDLWVLKINYGFSGLQTAIINVAERIIRMMRLFRCEILLIECLKHRIPKILQVKNIYNEKSDFFEDLDRFEGIIQACPTGNYKTLTVGCMNEHDTATPLLLTTAEVIKCEAEITSDIGYIIPQNILPEDDIKNLIEKIGNLLHDELYIGYFAVDIIVFTTPQNELRFWVIDVDPSYTDLQSFGDWTKFCLMSSGKNLNPKEIGVQAAECESRIVMCSGKLCSFGFENCYDYSLVEECRIRSILYCPKGKTGCMICPYDPEKRNILMFSIHRSKQLAVTNFISALRVIHKVTSSSDKSKVNNLLELARDLEKYLQLQ